MSASNRHEPLRLANGATIAPSGQVRSGTKLSSKSMNLDKSTTPRAEEDDKEDQAHNTFVTDPRKPKSIAELPLPPGKMHGVALICAYVLYGFSDSDIAHLLCIEVHRVEQVKLSKEYAKIFNDIVDSVRFSDANTVQGIISRSASNAAQRVVDTLNDDQVGSDLRLSAARDVLDRAGFRPVDKVEHSVEGGLVIEYVKKDTSITPIIDVTEGM